MNPTGGPAEPRWTMREFNESRARWQEFEHRVNERAYRMWLLEQESGDARRDEAEKRREVQ